MSLLSYIWVAICVPGLALLVFTGLTKVTFPFYNSPVVVMLVLTAAVDARLSLIIYPELLMRSGFSVVLSTYSTQTESQEEDIPKGYF